MFILWLWFAAYYEINDNQLLIVAGPIKKKIEIKEIKSIRPSRSILSSPALSMKRLEILYGKWGMVLIYPKNQENFCKNLLKINPMIDVNM
ncbi:PH domain-containing protein [Neobacillus mesonae]|uniref:PH domain-containing protein n=1 Tax=Neobacillus mesonae TaxID=1193713 RepID=UPI0037CB130C